MCLCVSGMLSASMPWAWVVETELCCLQEPPQGRASDDQILDSDSRGF